jgi:hypothetical protein
LREALQQQGEQNAEQTLCGVGGAGVRLRGVRPWGVRPWRTISRRFASANMICRQFRRLGKWSEFGW